jgi:SAM-dependent methyltransferase
MEGILSLDEIYAAHPLREETILARLGANASGTLTEWHLAIDPDTAITDQNHSGGVQAVLELALAAGVSAATTVADAGAGLAGSARVLAQAFGCRVDAYERDPGRCRDAASLTRRVGLERLVRIVQTDALTSSPPAGSIDVLWGQAAWIHFPDLDRFLDAWLPALRPGGRVAIADAHLLREEANADEETLIRRLERAWGGYLRPLAAWTGALERRGVRRIRVNDRSREAVRSFDEMIDASSRWPNGYATDAERESWALARRAFADGLVGNFQLTAAID